MEKEKRRGSYLSVKDNHAPPVSGTDKCGGVSLSGIDALGLDVVNDETRGFHVLHVQSTPSLILFDPVLQSK
jgi:hypothetical protein